MTFKKIFFEESINQISAVVEMVHIAMVAPDIEEKISLDEKENIVKALKGIK